MGPFSSRHMGSVCDQCPHQEHLCVVFLCLPLCTCAVYLFTLLHLCCFSVPLRLLLSKGAHTAEKGCVCVCLTPSRVRYGCVLVCMCLWHHNRASAQCAWWVMGVTQVRRLSKFSRRERESVCMQKREKESVCLCVWECVYGKEREKESLCLCVWECVYGKEREKESVFVCVRVCVWKRERERDR